MPQAIKARLERLEEHCRQSKARGAQLSVAELLIAEDADVYLSPLKSNAVEALSARANKLAQLVLKN